MAGELDSPFQPGYLTTVNADEKTLRSSNINIIVPFATSCVMSVFHYSLVFPIGEDHVIDLYLIQSD
jgi:hypothetical protein